MNCGRPWGAMGPHAEAKIEARDAWDDYLAGGTSEPITIELTEVYKVGEGTSNWWAEKFDVSPEPGWWALDEIHAHGIPDWATKKLKPRPCARIIDCCEMRIKPAALHD